MSSKVTPDGEQPPAQEKKRKKSTLKKKEKSPKEIHHELCKKHNIDPVSMLCCRRAGDG